MILPSVTEAVDAAVVRLTDWYYGELDTYLTDLHGAAGVAAVDYAPQGGHGGGGHDAARNRPRAALASGARSAPSFHLPLHRVGGPSSGARTSPQNYSAFGRCEPSRDGAADLASSVSAGSSMIRDLPATGG